VSTRARLRLILKLILFRLEAAVRSIRIFFALLFLFAASGALRAQNVRVDYDTNLDFSQFKTYAWEKGTPAKNSLWDQRITDGVDKQMVEKGFQKVSLSEHPDLVVLYHAALGEQTELNTLGMGWGARWGGRGTTTVDKIPTGQVTIDIGDAKTKKLAWMGTAKDTLSNNPQKDEKNLNKALAKMFKNFPPKPKK
jgi:hypothetical protein